MVRRCKVTGKVRYDSQTQADGVLRSIRRQSEKHSYRCWFCRGWHLTSQEQRFRAIPDRPIIVGYISNIWEKAR